MRILVVAAHPDDEVLGVGGTIARHAQNGDQVTIAILGEGISARLTEREQARPEDLAALKADARQAAELMGCSDLRLFGLPDNRLDSVDLLEIVKLIEPVIEEIRPEIVYTHHHGDLNIDHELTARATLTACRPLPGSSIQRILAFETPSATGWGLPDRPFVPTVFVDISATLPLKLRAVEAYRSETRPYPHPRSAKAIEDRARTWGAHAGLAAAEPFVLLREVQR